MPVDHVDVLIVGAGLSGIGAACHLQRECPGKTVAILESRATMGGTWDLFRYPGVRSDSDMFTLGYSFRPWTEAKSIADGPAIRSYINDTARDYGVVDKIRFNHRVVRIDWSSEQAQWTVTALRTDTGTDTGETVTLTAGFVSVCSGYYRYDEGYRPAFRGEESFGGQIVHPQHWPEDLDYAGKRVVVIGSGATAVTLVPAMAEQAEHVTMLQRSPTYVAALPSTDAIADLLRRRLPVRMAYPLARWKNVLMTMGTFQLSRRRPKIMKSMLRRGALRLLPAGFDVDTHFGPSYNPWDQRLCLIPDGDLFLTIRRGKADVVTDAIEEFTPTGIRLASGAELAADVIVTATGLNVLAIGGMTVVVDGREVQLRDTLAYKGMMLSGVPNFALTVGYTNASWTLKADLVARYVCRLLNHMDAAGFQTVTPVAPPVEDASLLRPLIDLQSGYVQRSLDALPKQGPAAPWRLYQNYVKDVRLMRRGPLDDSVQFGHAPATATASATTR